MSAPYVPNIGAAGRRRRLLGGAVWLGVGIIATAVLHARHVPRVFEIILVVPFTLAALGWFQSRGHT